MDTDNTLSLHISWKVVVLFIQWGYLDIKSKSVGIQLQWKAFAQKVQGPRFKSLVPQTNNKTVAVFDPELDGEMQKESQVKHPLQPPEICSVDFAKHILNAGLNRCDKRKYLFQRYESYIVQSNVHNFPCISSPSVQDKALNIDNMNGYIYLKEEKVKHTKMLIMFISGD